MSKSNAQASSSEDMYSRKSRDMFQRAESRVYSKKDWFLEPGQPERNPSNMGMSSREGQGALRTKTQNRYRVAEAQKLRASRVVGQLVGLSKLSDAQIEELGFNVKTVRKRIAQLSNGEVMQPEESKRIQKWRKKWEEKEGVVGNTDGSQSRDSEPSKGSPAYEQELPEGNRKEIGYF